MQQLHRRTQPNIGSLR